MKVLKAISRALVAAKAKMNIPCGVNADGESDLWIAQGVCAADVNIELAEGEVLLGNGAFVGDVLCLRSPCCNKGDVRKLRAVAGRPEWRHLRDVAVFSYQGERPEPDKMAGGDLDGDEYYFALARGAFYQIVLLAKEAAPAAYAARDPRSDDELRAWAAADAALKATTVFSPSAAATPPSATAMISSLRILLDRGKLVPRSAINWLLAVDRFGVASDAAERWARCHELALDVRTTGRGDAVDNAFDAAMRCSRSSSQQQPRWIPSGAAAPRGKLIDGKHPIMRGMFYRYGSIIDAVDKRIKQLQFDVDDPLARRAEAKLVGSVLDLSRAEEPETAARLVRDQRVSSFNDALHSAKEFALLAKQPRFVDARWALVLSHEDRKRLHRVMDSDKLYAPVRHRRAGVSRGTGPKKLVLTFKKQRREDFPDLLRLLADNSAGDADPSFREQFCAAVAFCEMGSVGEEKRFVFEGQHRGRVHEFFDCVEYEHVAHQTVEGKEILFKIKWAPTVAVDPMLDVARAHPEGLAKEMLDVEAAVKSVERATGAADRAPAPEIDERRAVDDVSAEAGDAAAAEEAAALQRALDESKARADEDAAAEAAERRSAELIVATIEARDEAEVKLADAVARQREAEDLARATALSARDIYGHEERKGGDSDTDYGDDEDEEAAPLAMLQPGPMAWTIGGGALTYAARAVEDRHAGVVFSTEDVDLERALAASLAETSAKDDELERALAASRAESGGDGDDDEQLRAVLARERTPQPTGREMTRRSPPDPSPAASKATRAWVVTRRRRARRSRSTPPLRSGRLGWRRSVAAAARGRRPRPRPARR